LGFVPLPPLYWTLLLATLLCYLGLTQRGEDMVVEEIMDLTTVLCIASGAPIR
jgi:hypothetical protein